MNDVVIEDQAGCVVGIWRDVLVVEWREAPTAPAVSRVSASIGKLALRWPEGIVVIPIMSGTIETPDAAGRDALARLVRERQSILRAGALVYEGEGFRAATVRSVLVGLQLVSRGRAILKSFSNAHEATSWLARQGIDSVSRPLEVQSVISKVRKAASAAPVAGAT